MNLREGTRRTALLLGAVGATLGGFASYVELQTVLNQRASHNKFEQLANSDVVRQERKSWSLTLRYAPKEGIEALRNLPEGQQRDVLRTFTREEKNDLLAKLKCASSDWGVESTAVIQGNLSRVENVPDGYILDAKPDPYACLAESVDPPISNVNKSDIQAISWSRKLSVESIKTEDGQTLYPTSVPSAWLCLLIALFPAFGFLIPWGTIRAIGWVGAGFVKPVN